MEKFSFIQACRHFFGQKEGQSPMQFGKEVMCLTPADKVEIATGLVANGYSIEPMPDGTK
jgi:hypothetical protein